MPLRCLLFTTDDAQVQPILQVISELGLEGEHCHDPVTAVEKVTTQLFQIVITDWRDQPEAAFLLKTARDLKASARPLTLAIVSDQERPQALQAGANSVLLKPLRPEQMRETIGTACELLRSKLQTAAPAAGRLMPLSSGIPGVGPAVAGAAAAAPARSILPRTAESERPEKLRAGDFLQTPSSAPSGQFDTESDVRESIEAVPSEAVDSLTDLEPTAASVQLIPESAPEPKEALTGWAALQARLNKNTPATPPSNSETKNSTDASNLLIFDPPSKETKSPLAGSEIKAAVPEAKFGEGEQDSQDESSTVSTEPSQPVSSGSVSTKHIKLVFICGFALTCSFITIVPRARRGAQIILRNSIRATTKWLNPPPASLPQTVTQHDSFAQEGDEYKLPGASSIPDATADSGQIQVVPVIDPTAKTDKTNSTASPATTVDQNQSSPVPPTPDQSTPPTASPQISSPIPAEQKDPAAATATTTQTPTPAATVEVGPTGRPLQQIPSGSQVTAQPIARDQPQLARSIQQPQPATTSSEKGTIPSSLQSQVAASTTPYSSGAKPDETAMSSIEPVKLPEAALRELLGQQPGDPEYPAAAKASGQRGIVVLQVLIGRDGAVQDAKFLQGSFLFARAAIDAVKQWQFKPYLMNGRAVSVQSVITLNFKPQS